VTVLVSGGLIVGVAVSVALGVGVGVSVGVSVTVTGGTPGSVVTGAVSVTTPVAPLCDRRLGARAGCSTATLTQARSKSW
jgi:hypothetical protein